jgi:peptidoglycan hydrolase CwlO-like protein
MTKKTLNKKKAEIAADIEKIDALANWIEARINHMDKLLNELEESIEQDGAS